MRVIRLDGVEHRFPADFTDAEIEGALSTGAAPPVPTAPAAPGATRSSQADVRRSEAEATPMSRQAASEAAFEAARKGWRRATSGVLRPGQTEDQAVSEWAKITSPRETREQAETEHLRETGEYTESDSVGYHGAKGIAAIGGFVSGGPVGATAAEAIVRQTALVYNLDRAIKAGAIDEDRAAEIFVAELKKGVGTDALFNFGVPLAGQLLAKIPGAKWLGEKVKAALEKAAGKATEGLPRTAAAPKPSARDVKLSELEALTEDPARKQAVRELGTRTKEVVPTPGQVSGEAGAVEAATRKASPAPFQRQERQLTEAAEGVRQDVLNPAGQPSAKALGERITEVAEATQAAVKKRLRPAFDAADNLGVNVDMRAVVKNAQDALAKDKLVPGGRLKPSERADLEALVAELNPQPGGFLKTTAEGTLDFVSRQKEKLRSISADGKPSSYYETVVKNLMDSANQSYAVAAGRAGKPEVAKNLLAAQKDYREMMETIYDDAVKAALKKNPEDIGRLFWQGGNVSEIEQLQRMLRIAEREGVASGAWSGKLTRDMARGFLQEAVRDVQSAAGWGAALKADPLKRRTWEALTQAPGGKQLRNAMAVLENAAQIASRSSISLAGGEIIPLGRAGIGQGYVTSMMRPGLVLTGLSLTGLTRAMATAYTQGNKGIINSLAQVLRASSAGTAAAAKSLQAALPQLEKWAANNDLEDLFVGEQPQEQPRSQYLNQSIGGVRG